MLFFFSEDLNAIIIATAQRAVSDIRKMEEFFLCFLAPRLFCVGFWCSGGGILQIARIRWAPEPSTQFTQNTVFIVFYRRYPQSHPKRNKSFMRWRKVFKLNSCEMFSQSSANIWHFLPNYFGAVNILHSHRPRYKLTIARVQAALRR